MPAALRLHLTDNERAAVARRFETTRAAETRLRYQMVLVAADGRTAPQVAPLVRRSPATVARVLHRYREEGADGVPHRCRPGRPPAVPPAGEAALRRVIERAPHTGGVDSANWTTQLLAAYLAHVTGPRTSIETVRVHLHTAGYVCKRPPWTLQGKAQEQPEGAKNA